MSDSCCVPTEVDVTCGVPTTAAPAVCVTCPSCRKWGKAVPMETVKAQLAISLHALTQTGYRFCATPDCPVVYFTPDGEGWFTTDQIRERVYQKQPDDDTVLVCYCFAHSASELRNGDVTAQATILADITAGTKQGQCACELRNPQGACCLGNVRRLIRQATLEVPA